MSKSKKRILICVDWYEPGYKAGGPIRSVASLVTALKDEFEFYILTSAYDLGEEEPYEGIEMDQWYDNNGVFIKYMSHKIMKSSAIKGNILEIQPDMLYLNSLFSKLFTLAPLLVARRKRIKVVLAPRGMLGAGALDIKKGKKKSFLSFSKMIGLYRNVIWHASTKMEEAEIKKVFGKKANVIVAQNIPAGQIYELDDVLDKKDTGANRFVFISRISKKKNLDLAIESFKNIESKSEVYFDIYGHIEDQEYFDSFKDEIKSHGNIHIEYKGALIPSMVAEVYANADFLVLPTMHENYGHAIVEAWANGCPVIISKNTPWRNLRVQDLGWDVDIKKENSLAEVVQEAVDLDFASYIAMSRASYKYFADKLTENEIIKANKKLFYGAN